MAIETASVLSKSRVDSRERIVQAAADLFYLQGFQGTSLDMVARKAEANRGSLYYFFKSKKNLALAVIDHFERLLHDHFIEPALGGEENGREKLARLADFYSRMPSQSAPCCGCPIGKLSLELCGIDEDFRLRFKEVWAAVISRIEVAVRQSVEEELLRPVEDTTGLARVFFEQIQGAHLIARSMLDEETLRKDCRDAYERLPWVN